MSDFERYTLLQKLMADILAESGALALDRPIYNSLWAESERIKNKHGGMPPENTEQNQSVGGGRWHRVTDPMNPPPPGYIKQIKPICPAPE